MVKALYLPARCSEEIHSCRSRMRRIEPLTLIIPIRASRRIRHSSYTSPVAVPPVLSVGALMSLLKHSIWTVVRKFFLSEQSYSEHLFWLKFRSNVCLRVGDIPLQILCCGNDDNTSLLLQFMKKSTNILHLIWAPPKHTDRTFCFLIEFLSLIFLIDLQTHLCYITVRQCYSKRNTVSDWTRFSVAIRFDVSSLT